MISKYEVLDTIKMIDTENLDVRTITMGISLRDCVSADARVCCENIVRKIVDKAKDLVRVGDDIAREFGVPIVNKRISVTPISEKSRIYASVALRISCSYSAEESSYTAHTRMPAAFAV